MDRDLVVRAQKGDRAAYGQIVESVIAALDGAARLILGSRQLAKDAVTEAFVRGWRDLLDLADPDRFEPLLRQLLVRACLARIQRGTGAVIDDHVADDPSGHAAESRTSAEEERVRGALLALEPEQRSLVVLREYLRLSIEDAADAVGIGVEAAQPRFDRARRTLLGPLTGQSTAPGGTPASGAGSQDLLVFKRAAAVGKTVPYLGDVLRRIGRTRQGRRPALPSRPSSFDPRSALGAPALMLVVLVAAITLVAAPALLGARPQKGQPAAAASASPARTSAPSAVPTPSPVPEVAAVCDHLIRRLNPEQLDLTGPWAGDDGGIYYLRQEGKDLWWNGMSSRDAEPLTLGRDWNNVGKGMINDDLTIDVDWADVPRGGILGYGTLDLQIEGVGPDDMQLRKVAETGTGFGNTVWTPCLPE